jgi:hypothetical protein
MTNPPPTSSPLPTTPAGCSGDCNSDGSVSIDEIVQLVNAALGNAIECPDTAGGVTVDLIVSAVTYALSGCPRG